MFLWGKALEGGNRKMDFFFEENYFILKISKKTQIKIDIIPFLDRKRKEEVKKIMQMVKDNQLSITARVTKTHVYLTFDNETLNGYSFDIQKFNTTIKEHPIKNTKEGRSEIRKELFEEQKQRKLKNKIENRSAGLDFNPHDIGFSISDINKISGEVDETIFSIAFDVSYYTKQPNLSEKDREKFKYELARIYSFIIQKCIHYKVGYFGYEDLTNITNSLSNNSTEFNRITKNVWNRGLQKSLLIGRCDEIGIISEDVKAMYSSFIGNIKYNLYDPIAASVEVSRRGYCKFKKITGNQWFPSIDKEDYEKMFYLTGQDLSNKKTWVALHKSFKKVDMPGSGGKWRNKSFTAGGYLDSKKSNVRICF